jgi:hypothetical protein
MSHYPRMRTSLHLVAAFTLAAGCSSSDVIPGSSDFGSSGGGTAVGGTTSSAGGNLGGVSGGLGVAGAAQGGATGSGGTSGAGGSGPSAGGKSSGAGGTSVNSGGAGQSSGGASQSAGGAGGCVQNLKCTLAPAPTTGDIHQDCVDRINQFRTQCACLPALARWTEGEACADQMSQYDSEQNVAHAGFKAKVCSGGTAQDECPGYRSNDQVISTCLQQMWNEGPPPTPTCTDACFQMYGHFINMSNTKYTKVACGFYTMPTGKIWAAQNFSR